MNGTFLNKGDYVADLEKGLKNKFKCDWLEQTGHDDVKLDRWCKKKKQQNGMRNSVLLAIFSQSTIPVE